jgi:hypothetical protein
LGCKALAPNRNDEVPKLDVHLGKMDVGPGIKDFRFPGFPKDLIHPAYFKRFPKSNRLMELEWKLIL